MTFARSWVLFVAWLPLAWVIWEYRRSQRPIALLLKGLSLFAILLALAEPILKTNETKLAVAILADTSSSLSPEDLGRASQVANNINDARGRHWTRLIPFARTTRAQLRAALPVRALPGGRPARPGLCGAEDPPAPCNCGRSDGRDTI